jgi:hypothetical protein
MRKKFVYSRQEDGIVISPSIGYTSAINPIVSRPTAGLQTSTTRNGDGLSRSTFALLESMQAGRRVSTLLSSLAESTSSPMSTLALMLRGQSTPLHTTGALLESLQAGRQTSALLSSLSTKPAAEPLGPLPSLATRVNAAFGNRQAEVSLAGQLIQANAIRQPSAEGNKAALRAYVQEVQARLGSGPQVPGSEWPHEWFA